MRRSSILLAAAVPLLAAAPADAQRDLRAGGFHVRLHASGGEDRSLALVLPDSESGYGALLFACDGAGTAAGVRIWNPRGSRVARQATWRFDQDEPLTVQLQGAARSGVWLLGVEDAARVAERARTASRLALTVAPDSAGEPERFAYALTGADSALALLACGAQPGRGRAQGAATLRAASRVPWVDARGRLTDAAWETMPAVENASAVGRWMERNYPRDMRDRAMSGTVEVRLRVLEDGQVDSASVTVVRTTHAGFNEAAVTLARMMRFRPALLWGRPVKVWVDQPLHFVFPAPEPARGSSRPRR